MRSFDELMACEYVIDFTPDELYTFISEVVDRRVALRRSYARSILAEDLAKSRVNVHEALQQQSRDELNQILRDVQNMESKARAGHYDYKEGEEV